MRKSLAPNTGFGGNNNHASNGMRKSAAPNTMNSVRKSTMQNGSRYAATYTLGDIKQHEAKYLQLAVQLLPNFLQQTHFSGAVPTPFTPKNMRKEDFIAIFAHVLTQIDPTFKYTQSWDVEFEIFAKSYGYPFTLPSRSAISSFEVSDSTKRSVIIFLVWVVQFVQYFKATFAPGIGYYDYASISKLPPPPAPQAGQEEEDLDTVTTFLLVRNSYHEWLQSGDDNCIARELLVTTRQEHTQLNEEIEQLTKDQHELKKAVKQYDNINDEIAKLKARIAALNEHITKEEEMTIDCQSKLQRVEMKIQEKDLIFNAKEAEANKMQKVINNINILLNQQTQSEEELNRLRKSSLLYQQKGEQLSKQIDLNQTDINQCQQNLLQQLNNIKNTIDEINSLYAQYKHDYQDYHVHNIIEIKEDGSNLNQKSKNNNNNNNKNIHDNNIEYPIKLLNLPQLSENEINAYIQLPSQHNNNNNQQEEKSNKQRQSPDIFGSPNFQTPTLVTPQVNNTTGSTDQNKLIPHLTPMLQGAATANTLPKLYQQIPPNSINTTSQNYYQTKRLLSTNVLTLTTQQQRIDNEYERYEQLSAQLSKEIGVLQNHITTLHEQQTKIERKYQDNTNTILNKQQLIQDDLDKLANSDEELNKIRNECEKIKIKYHQMIDTQSNTEQEYSDLLMQICWDVGAHLSSTHILTLDCLRRGKEIKSQIYIYMSNFQNNIDATVSNNLE